MLPKMTKPKMPDLDDLQAEDTFDNEKYIMINGKKKLRIPKSQYDDENRPILLVEDLDDLSLDDEMDKYL